MSRTVISVVEVELDTTDLALPAGGSHLRSQTFNCEAGRVGGAEQKDDICFRRLTSKKSGFKIVDGHAFQKYHVSYMAAMLNGGGNNFWICNLFRQLELIEDCRRTIAFHSWVQASTLLSPIDSRACWLSVVYSCVPT